MILECAAKQTVEQVLLVHIPILYLFEGLPFLFEMKTIEIFRERITNRYSLLCRRP